MQNTHTHEIRHTQTCTLRANKHTRVWRQANKNKRFEYIWTDRASYQATIGRFLYASSFLSHTRGYVCFSLLFQTAFIFPFRNLNATHTHTRTQITFIKVILIFVTRSHTRIHNVYHFYFNFTAKRHCGCVKEMSSEIHTIIRII